ncbi:MAG: sigma-E factor negative regulatory protein [Gammaproteobacteria bacterium]|nr:sigma-E factor negative regulatory protein [Gammaproteobacteria bacterium]
MSSQLKESLSAVVDGEADEFELRRVLDETGRNPELLASWRRYHAIGALIRGEVTGGSSFARTSLNRVWAGLARGEAAADPASGARFDMASSSWVRRLAGTAVAASVALGVIAGFGQFGTPSGVADSIASAVQSPPVLTVPVAARLDADANPDASADAADAYVEANDELYREVIATAPAPVDAEQLRSFPSASDVVRSQGYILLHAHQVGVNRPAGPTAFVKVAAFESR